MWHPIVGTRSDRHSKACARDQFSSVGRAGRTMQSRRPVRNLNPAARTVNPLVISAWSLVFPESAPAAAIVHLCRLGKSLRTGNATSPRKRAPWGLAFLLRDPISGVAQDVMSVRRSRTYSSIVQLALPLVRPATPPGTRSSRQRRARSSPSGAEMVEAAGIEPACRSPAEPGFYVCSPRIGSRLRSALRRQTFGTYVGRFRSRVPVLEPGQLGRSEGSFECHARARPSAAAVRR